MADRVGAAGNAHNNAEVVRNVLSLPRKKHAACACAMVL